jgi:hypothetical protein
LPASTSFIFEFENEVKDRDPNKSVENNITNLTIDDGETSDVISSEEEYESDEDGSHPYEGSDAMFMDDEDTIMEEDDRDINNELDSKEDSYKSNENFLSKFHVIRAGKDKISKEEEERILSLRKEFGYATKWMYAEDDELLPVHIIF